jgi:thioredoxin reductase (NADPH)
MSSNGNAKHVKVLVLGSGPTGYSAALYAARAELQPVVLTGMQLGGQAALTYTVENYPGFPEGVGGAQLGELFQKQAEHFGAVTEFDTANSVDLSQRPFKVTTDSGEYLADTLVVGTGASPNHLDIPGEVELTGRGVSYCATCDGWFFKDKKVVVVGGGDSALEEALFITRYASSVTIIHRREEFRAGAILQHRAKAHPKLNFILNTVVTEVVGTDKLEALKLKNVITGDETIHETDGLFIFIGHTPNTEMFKNKLEMSDLGYIGSMKRMETTCRASLRGGRPALPAGGHIRGMGAAAPFRRPASSKRDQDKAWKEADSGASSATVSCTKSGGRKSDKCAFRSNQFGIKFHKLLRKYINQNPGCFLQWFSDRATSLKMKQRA